MMKNINIARMELELLETELNQILEQDDDSQLDLGYILDIREKVTEIKEMMSNG